MPSSDRLKPALLWSIGNFINRYPDNINVLASFRSGRPKITLYATEGVLTTMKLACLVVLKGFVPKVIACKLYCLCCED